MFSRVYVCKVRDQISKIGNGGACVVWRDVVHGIVLSLSLSLSTVH